MASSGPKAPPPSSRAASGGLGFPRWVWSWESQPVSWPQLPLPAGSSFQPALECCLCLPLRREGEPPGAGDLWGTERRHCCEAGEAHRSQGQKGREACTARSSCLDGAGPSGGQGAVLPHPGPVLGEAEGRPSEMFDPQKKGSLRWAHQVRARHPLVRDAVGHPGSTCAVEPDDFFFVFKKKFTLASVAQWIECQPANQRLTSLIPSQGTFLGCGPGPQ